MFQHTRRAVVALASTSVLIGAAPAALAQGTTPVAQISVELPSTEYFLLQATLPVPPGTFDTPGSESTLAIVVDGDAVTTQMESVARYPDAADGASVVELIARVQRPQGASPGDEVGFDVVRHVHTPGTAAPHNSVQQLLATAGTLRVQARDLHGNRYEADLYRKPRLGLPGPEVLRRGPFVSEIRTHEVMNAPSASIGHALPHLFGVHTTVRTYANERFIALDLHVHNGLDGLSPSTAIDDALPDVYFDQLDLIVPSGWRLIPVHDSPQYGARVGGSQWDVWPIVDGLPGGQFHVLPQQAQFTRRFLLAPDSASTVRGREVVQRRTQGFAVPGRLPNGDLLWSWWNEETAGYLPQRGVLPTLDFLDRNALVQELENRFDQYSQILATGTKSSNGYPFEQGLMGWAHPWGVAYGGMSGGTEISQWPAVDVAWARSQKAIRGLEIQAQAYEDRQPIALYDPNGRPTWVEDLVNPQGNHGPWIGTFFNLRPTGSGDPFGFHSADDTQVVQAFETFQLPSYEKDLRSYGPIDMQHLTRYLNAWLALAWFTNDAEAKRALELAGELNRTTFSEYYNSNHGHVQRQGLLARIQDAQVAGGRGGDFGRAVAWGMQASLAAYALGDDPLRARYRPWLRQTIRTARDAVSTCTGNPTSIQITKHFKGVYQSRQSFEVSFFLHAVQGLRRAVFEDADPQSHAIATEVLLDGARSTITAPFWNSALGGQHALIGVRPMPITSNDFCTNLPPDALAGFIDGYTPRSVWAYAYEASGDGLFLTRATESMGGGQNLQAQLEGLGLSGMADHAALLALLQVLNR